MAAPSRSPVTTADLVRLVTTWLDTLASEHTRHRYRRDLAALATWLYLHRQRHLLDARATDVLDYCHVLTGRRHDLTAHEHPLRRHNTIATTATAWSSFYTHCTAIGLLTDNPVRQARALDPVAAYAPHPRRTPPPLDAAALRALITEAHRDPWLGGPLGASLLGLLIAVHWRAERITSCTLRDLARRGGIRDRTRWIPLPPEVHGYLTAWLTERPTIDGHRVFTQPSGLRPITAIDLHRLVARCARRAGLGHSVTTTQLAHIAGALAAGGEPVALPTLEQLRHRAPAPQQLALPDDPRDYAPDWQDYGQQALLPLPGSLTASAAHTPMLPSGLATDLRHRVHEHGAARIDEGQL
ncbi:tyrosine-type recombinase/integrase [Allokutzneria oryzae]|uniref:Tyrosine-type recombinase/integrase n=1 Tax=Allokutzneria oryzae TaxID=1378989 RepID=A0ABV6A410_9PSEU